jgi:hypothetical protein
MAFSGFQQLSKKRWIRPWMRPSQIHRGRTHSLPPDPLTSLEAKSLETSKIAWTTLAWCLHILRLRQALYANQF